MPLNFFGVSLTVHRINDSRQTPRIIMSPEQISQSYTKALNEALEAELGQASGPLHDAMAPMLKHVFERGVMTGIDIQNRLNKECTETLRKWIVEIIPQAAPKPSASASGGTRARKPRTSGARKSRAAPGSIRIAIGEVLANGAALRIVDIQDAVIDLDESISRPSVTNELRRNLGTRYRQDGKLWSLIEEIEKESPDPGTSGQAHSQDGATASAAADAEASTSRAA